MRSVRIVPPPRRMSTRDAGFLYLERPHALLHIGCVAIVDGPVDRSALAHRIEARISRMRRYGQRAAGVPLSLGHPSWEDDPGFDPDRHVHRWALPTPGGEAELLDAAQALLAQPLDRSRPLWEMHILEGLDNGRTAVLQKVHHCMVDGVAGAQLLDVLLDVAPGADPRPEDPGMARPVPGPRPPTPAGRVRSAILDGVRRGTRDVARTMGAAMRPGAARASADKLRAAAFSALRLAARGLPAMPWNAPIGARRRLAFTRLPLDGVGRIRAAHGGTVNDVVLSTLAGGLHRYLEGNGIPTRSLELVALVPVSLRSPEEAGAFGNRISAMLVPLAADLGEEVPRLAATRAITDRLKSSGAWVGIDALLAFLDALPPPLVALVGRQLRLGQLANVVATNVPGPRETRYLGGARVEALYPIVPIVDGLGLGLAVFSYDGWLHVGLNADADAVPDLEKLQRAVEEAFAQLLVGAG